MKYTMNKMLKELPTGETGHKQSFRIPVKKSMTAAIGLYKQRCGLPHLALRGTQRNLAGR